MNRKTALLRKFAARQATVAVVGLGYVGLPLGVAFAEAGFTALGVEVDAGKVKRINRGRSEISDVSCEQLSALTRAGKLRATLDYAELGDADAIIICVPTPLRKTRDPDMSYIIDATRAIAKVCARGSLIVLESTTYPGTTEEIVLPEIMRGDWRAGEDIFIAYSPERIDPGNKRFSVRNTPKVVGGISEGCAEVARALYACAVDEVVAVSSPTAAEMVKLLENTFRAVNIGMVNEMALMCDKLGVDVWEVIRAAATKPFGYMPFYPGPGLGGHCIPVDPHYLSWKLKMLNYNARFIELASEINTAMPYYVIDKITKALNDQRLSARDARVLALGVAYKRDVADVRESPALDVISLLRQRGAIVDYCDPHVPAIQLESNIRLEAVTCNPELLRQADCVVILTDHSAFDWDEVAANSRVIVDTRHVLADVNSGATVLRL